jgi:hypoxanthine phosphoribosyltransferase
MHLDIDRILLSQDQIARRVKELAAQITADHAVAAQGAGLTIVPVMTGALIFCADLIRQIPVAMKLGLMTVSSYPGKSVTSQGPQVLAERIGEIAGRHVLVLDDVLDSGSTLRMVVPALRGMHAASVKSCVLLRKDRPAAKDVEVDYVGFDIPDEFVVGYGLDYNDYYRNVPDVVTLKPHVLARSS